MALADVEPALQKWGYTDNPLHTQTIAHLLNSCSVYKFEGGLPALHTASEICQRVATPSQVRVLNKDHAIPVGRVGMQVNYRYNRKQIGYNRCKA